MPSSELVLEEGLLPLEEGDILLADELPRPEEKEKGIRLLKKEVLFFQKKVWLFQE